MAKEDKDKDKDAGADVNDKADDKSTTSTPPADDKKTETKAKTEKVLVIVSKREGFRRAGHAFGAEAVTLRVVDLSKEQVKMLKNEPMLVVTQTERKI